MLLLYVEFEKCFLQAAVFILTGGLRGLEEVGGQQRKKLEPTIDVLSSTFTSTGNVFHDSKGETETLKHVSVALCTATDAESCWR